MSRGEGFPLTVHKGKIIERKRREKPAYQGRSGSARRLPGLLRRRTTRGNKLEAQGEGLKILLTLVEGIGRFSGENKCLVCIF